jgi:hypothetical protein
MDINIGKWVTAIRQVIALAAPITGVTPFVTRPTVPPTTEDLVPKYAKCIFTYCDPVDATLEVAEDGGEFIFSPPNHESYSVRITEIQAICGAGSLITATIVDSDGTHPRTILSGVSGVDDRHIPVDACVLAGQKLIIVETVAGAPAVDKVLTVYAIQEGRV